MIATLMLYAIVVTALFAVAAMVAEGGLRVVRRPARLVWLLAIVTSIGCVMLALFSRPTSEATVVPPVANITTLGAHTEVPVSNANNGTTIQAPNVGAYHAADAVALRPLSGSRSIMYFPGPTLARFDKPLATLLIASAVFATLVIVVAAARVSRTRPSWKETTVAGVPVSLTRDIGPAVVGVFRFRILLPAWVWRLTEDELQLVLLHEREHARVGDPALLFAAMMLAALMPWNVALWFMVKRLRCAVELDCDARVLRRHPDTRRYGSLLIDLSQRAQGMPYPILALAEPVSLVERRILAMRRRVRRFAPLKSMIAGTVAGALAGVAYGMPRPHVDMRQSHMWRSGEVATMQSGKASASQQTPSAPTSRRSANESQSQAATIVVPRAVSEVGASPATTNQSVDASSWLTYSVPREIPANVLPGSVQATLAPTEITDIFAGCDASGSSNDSEHSSDTEHGTSWTLRARIGKCGISLRSEGVVRFNPSVSAIEHISPNGFVEITTNIDGVISRLVAKGTADESASYSFEVDGRSTPFSTADTSWMARVLLGMDRISAFAIDERFPVLFANGGSAAIIKEVTHMHNDHAAAQYLTRLTARGPLEPKLQQPFVATAKNLNVDHERAAVFTSLLDGTVLDRDQIIAIMQSVATLNVDSEKARVLFDIVRTQDMNGYQRDAYTKAAATISNVRLRMRVVASLGKVF